MKEKNALDWFDPNGIGLASNGIFWLPFNEKTADILIIPVPRDVTTSYRAGTSRGPEYITEASLQVDLHDPLNPWFWKSGIALKTLPLFHKKSLIKRNDELRKKSEIYLKFLENGWDIQRSTKMKSIVNEINKSWEELNTLIKNTIVSLQKQKKHIVLMGGDHSTSLWYIQAQAKSHPQWFGILHFDAHADLREAYEGFIYSHGSVMFNAMQIPQVKKLVQVGIRDYCEAEEKLIKQNKKITSFTQRDINRNEYEWKSWKNICDQIIKALPEKVHISFDIDGLDPSLCPNTGTPVPGGLTYSQAVYLFEKLVSSGKKIIGFDLVEVGAAEWDANVASRLLYKMCAVMHAS